MLIAHHFTDGIGRPQVTICDRSEWAMFLASMYFVKRSPVGEAYNKFLREAIAGGLYLKYFRDANNELSIRHGLVPANEMSLSIENLQGAFILIALGLMCSILVICGELVHYHLLK